MPPRDANFYEGEGVANKLKDWVRTLTTSIERCVDLWKVAKNALRWNVLFFFDAHTVLFTVCILGASSYETRRANDTASILVIYTDNTLNT